MPHRRRVETRRRVRGLQIGLEGAAVRTLRRAYHARQEESAYGEYVDAEVLEYDFSCLPFAACSCYVPGMDRPHIFAVN